MAADSSESPRWQSAFLAGGRYPQVVAEPSPRRPRRIGNILLFAAGVVVVLSAAIGLTTRPRLEHWLRTTVIATLEKRLDSEVELARISVQLGPLTRISGGPLTIRHRRRHDVA